MKYSENLIPTMTSKNTPSGMVEASKKYNGLDTGMYAPYRAFDKDIISAYYGWSSILVPSWIYYKFDKPTKICKYTIKTIPSLNTGYAPKTWTFEGSNDGTNWTILDTQTNQTGWNNTKREFEFNNNIQYLYYKLNVSNSNNGANLGIGEIEMMDSLPITRYLIKQDEQYYSVKDNQLIELGIPADDAQKEQWFDDYGVDNLKEALLTPDANGNKLIDDLNNQFEVRMMKAK